MVATTVRVSGSMTLIELPRLFTTQNKPLGARAIERGARPTFTSPSRARVTVSNDAHRVVVLVDHPQARIAAGRALDQQVGGCGRLRGCRRQVDLLQEAAALHRAVVVHHGQRHVVDAAAACTRGWRRPPTTKPSRRCRRRSSTCSAGSAQSRWPRTPRRRWHWRWRGHGQGAQDQRYLVVDRPDEAGAGSVDAVAGRHDDVVAAGQGRRAADHPVALSIVNPGGSVVAL